MQLIAFEFQGADDSAIPSGYLPLSDLSVLIGPNDSGKSSTLGLLARSLMVASHPNWRPAGFASLPRAARSTLYVEGTEGDRDFLLAAVASPEHAPDAEFPANDAEMEISEMYLWPRPRVHAAAAACESDLCERFGDREGALLMAALRATNVFAFEGSASDQEHSWTVCWCLPRAHSLAGVALQELGDDQEGETGPASTRAPIRLWRLGATSAQLLPHAVMAPVGMEAPRSELEEYIGRVATHVRLNDVSDHLYDDALQIDYDDHGSWLLGSRGGREVRVDPVVEAIIKAAEVAAAGRLPAFVREAYRLRLRIQPIPRWSHGRLAILLERADDAGVAFTADKAAAGLRTWIEIALLEAVSMLAAWAGAGEYLLVPDHDWDVGVEEPDEVTRVTDVLRADVLLDDPLILSRERGRADDLTVWAFANLDRHSQMDLDQLARTLRRYVYLIDEPERHLQPGLQRLAARWLQETFREGGSQAVIATHAPAFLNSGSDLHVVRVRRAGDVDPFEEINPSGLRATDAIAREMGFDRGELLAGITAVLYVEGAVDRAVLESLVGPELRAARIVVSAFGGTHNVTEVVRDPLLSYTTARVAVLVDNLQEDRIKRLREDLEFRQERADRGVTEGDWIARLLNDAELVGRRVEPFGLTERDIFFLLDDSALRAVSASWPGHAEAWSQWQEHKKAQGKRENQWKDFFRTTFNVAVDSATACRAAEHMRERDAVPDQLRELLIKIELLGLDALEASDD